MQDFTPEQQRKLAAASPQILWNGFVGSILSVQKNSPMALILIDALLKSNSPLTAIVDQIGDPETEQPFTFDSNPVLRQALMKALSYRRNQLRMAASAVNN